MPKFNLIEEAWIPVRDDGRVREVSLRDALVHAHEYERIEDPSPLVEVALLRVLLAVLHRAFEGPANEDELVDLFEAGRFPEDQIDAYLDRFHDRFWLIHDEAPFWQVSDLSEDDPLPWTKLLPEYASGNNPTLFSHASDDTPPPASYAEAARALVAHQTFTPGGLLRRLGVGSAVAAPLATAAAFVATGKNLFDTLVFSLGVYTPEHDRPVWEEEPLRSHDIAAAKDGKPRARWPLAGRTRIYTWPSRGVRLLPEGELVYFIAYGPGVHPQGSEPPPEDPLLALAVNPQKKTLSAVRLREDRAFWRDFTALFPKPEHGSPPRTLETAYELVGDRYDSIALAVAGQVTNQAKVLEIRREHYPLPAKVDENVLPGHIENALTYVEDIAGCLRKAIWVLSMRILSETRDPDQNDVRNVQQSLPALPSYYHMLGNEFPAFLLELNVSATNALARWRKTTRQAALGSWILTRNSVGTEPRMLKALQHGERSLSACLRKLEEKHE
ncbi:type I-E CRISPR-associated protein Cse1/CasA [Deinococcota bacterium DY0809b]